MHIQDTNMWLQHMTCANMGLAMQRLVTQGAGDTGCTDDLRDTWALPAWSCFGTF